MFIGVLGPLEVRDDGGAGVAVPGERLRALLVRLALAEGQPVGVDALVDAVWGDSPPAGAANALQSLVSRLRRLLPAGRVTSLSTGYRLSLVPDELDVAQFTVLLGQARAAGDPALFSRALALWRGEPEVADPAVVARLEDQRVSAVEDLLAAGGTLDGDELAALAQRYPVRERLQGLWMRAVAAAGRPAEALTMFEALRVRLAEELGVDPSPELRAAHLAVLRGAPRPARTNVRAALTSFVGRDDERKQLGRLLDEARLVTLVGPGGAGKTRLANRIVAERVGAHGPRGRRGRGLDRRAGRRDRCRRGADGDHHGARAAPHRAARRGRPARGRVDHDRAPGRRPAGQGTPGGAGQLRAPDRRLRPGGRRDRRRV